MGALLNNNTFLKAAGVFFLFIIGCFVYYSFNLLQEVDRLEKLEQQQREQIELVKKRYKKEIQRNDAKKDSLVEVLNSQIVELINNKNETIQQFNEVELNPPYDIDFYAAFRIISESDYKRREGNDNP